MRPKAHYFDKDEFRLELAKSHEVNQLTERAMMMIHTLAQHRIRSKIYLNVDATDRYDIMMGAIYVMYKYWRSFKLDRVDDNGRPLSPLAYFTQIFNNGARKAYNELRKKKDGYDVKFLSMNFLGRDSDEDWNI